MAMTETAQKGARLHSVSVSEEHRADGHTITDPASSAANGQSGNEESKSEGASDQAIRQNPTTAAIPVRVSQRTQNVKKLARGDPSDTGFKSKAKVSV